MEMYNSPSVKNDSNNSMRAKKLWNVLRIAFFMIRKGTLLSKRKLVMDMNLMMKRGKLLRKNLRNLVTFHHDHHSRNVTKGGGIGTGHYEFSCTNTPNHVSLFNMSKKRNKQHHNYYFSCINPTAHGRYDDDIEGEVPRHIEQVQANNKVVVKPKQYYYYSTFGTPDLAPGEKLISPSIVSPFPIRISNYSSSSEDEYEEDDRDEEDGSIDNIEVDIGGDINNELVDAAAEDFIRKFYEQLRVQSTTISTSTIGVH